MHTRSPHLRRARSGGYTAVEVLMAMTVFAIGASGVIAMQRAAVQGNLDARRLDVANAIARGWVDRLRRDATLWTTPTNIDQTNYFSSTASYLDKNAWMFPDRLCPKTSSGTPAPDGLCPAFDVFGHDLAQDAYANATFCVNIRLDTVSQDLIRAEVRVYWPRYLATAPVTAANGGFCSLSALGDTAGPNAANAPNIYHFVDASTLVRRSPAQ